MSRTFLWLALVASGGASPARLAKLRYGSPDITDSSSAASPDRAAAIQTSWALQSM